MKPHPSGDDLAVWVRGCRESLHMSQSELAKRIGVTPSHVSYIESGKRDVSLATLREMTQLFATAFIVR